MIRWYVSAAIISTACAFTGCGEDQGSSRTTVHEGHEPVAATPGANLNDGDPAAYSGLLHHVYGPNSETTGFAVDQGRERIEVDLRTIGEDPLHWANQLVAVEGRWAVVHGDFFPNRWLVVVSSIAPMHADLSCDGPALDGASNYNALAFKNADGKYARTILQQYKAANASDVQTQGDFNQYQDGTPGPPTDIRFRYIFGLSEPVTGDFIVTLTGGGFTDQAVVEVKEVKGSGSVVRGDMTCMEK